MLRLVQPLGYFTIYCDNLKESKSLLRITTNLPLTFPNTGNKDLHILAMNHDRHTGFSGFVLTLSILFLTDLHANNHSRTSVCSICIYKIVPRDVKLDRIGTSVCICVMSELTS